MKPQVEQDLAHLLLTELLAYQFASPVRWIETQDVIFGDKRTERIVEIGPSATLAGMATRTLNQNYKSFDAALSLEREILCYAKDQKDIYYTYDPEVETDEAAGATDGAPASAISGAGVAVTAAVAAAAAPATSAPAVVAEIPDKSLTPLQVLHAIIAIKLRKPLEQIPVSKAIKDLVGGKSTVQNEILGELAKEFNANPEKAEEVPIDELSSQFSDGFTGKLGKHTSSLVNKFSAAKMPGGFGLSNIRKYLQTRWGLPAGHQDAILLIALTQEPAARLKAESDAKEFFEKIVISYGQANGIDFAAASAASAPGGGAAGATVSAEALEAVTKDQKYLARQQLELLARYLTIDLRDGDKKLTSQVQANELLQKELDLWLAEHGDVYADGIVPIFAASKARTYDSSWNWARQDCLRMFYDIIWGRLDTVDRETLSRCIAILNRSSPTLIDMMVYYIDTVPTERGETFALARELAKQLLDSCSEFLGNEPLYKDVFVPKGPKTIVDSKGNIEYYEEPRPNCRKLEKYVFDMAVGNELTRDTGPDSLAHLERLFHSLEVTDDVSQAYNLLKSRLETQQAATPLAKGMRSDIVPYLHLKARKNEVWSYDKKLTSEYLDVLESCAREGLSLAGKTVLLTGAGKGSIGEKVLEGLLSGGAKVVVTTSRYSKETCDHYQSIYTRFGGSGSTLIVVPFNQASKTDVRALVEYIYSKSGLDWDLDFIIPFAAIPEGGIEIDGIDSKSELAHRLMLTNLMRLLGGVKTHKQAHNIETRPAQVILPLSPNHGTFGGDGMYSESKLSLETLFNRWESESWGNYLTVCGAVIGWTRGTGLMSQNNLVAAGIESLGVRTFSQQEMAFNLLGLLNPKIVAICQETPVWADLNGGMQYVPGLKDHMARLRSELLSQAELRRAVAVETGIEHNVVNGPGAAAPFADVTIKPRANPKFEFPTLPKYEDLPSKKLQDLVDLEKVAVITGFSEVGPWGNARTRWEMEANGEFSIEGTAEMAWIMGLIKYFSGSLKNKPYSGWVDAKTNEPVDEHDMKAKYEKHILEHTGIRLVEPDILSYDPKQKQLLQEVIIEHDLEPFEASKEAAEQFKLEQGNSVEVFALPDGEMWTVRFLKGARILVPKALSYNRLVAGQVPTGWDARRYGVPEDICEQVDPITLFALVSTIEALVSSGITDPYEFYKYVHVSEVGNASGSGMGGMTALRKMFKDRYLEKQVQNDILQESFINTMSAWVNMLLLSSSGPIKTPVGACATAVESVDTGVELIRNGSAKVVIVGGYDDIKEEGVQEFGNMNATSNSVTEIENGRTPREMSRPTTTSRAGFMEAHGAGIQILMSGDLAIKMGVPVYGIVALTATATDKIGRSVPAPGKGIMTVAREKPTKSGKHPLLDIDYRRRQLETRHKQIKSWVDSEHELLRQERDDMDEEEFADRLEALQSDARRQEREAMCTWGNDFYNKNAHIAPLRGALAQWDLTIDDIGISSFHGTSTKANDKNESAAIHDMLVHLGRTKGNPVLGIFQKYLTGHPKGAAGAWMLNGVIQSINSGVVPGNRNADNIDSALKDFDRIVFPSISLQTFGIKAGTVTSFGFGQKGAFALVVHPDYLFSVLDKSTYEGYCEKVSARYNKVYRYYHESICQNNLFRAKDKAPYTAEQETKVYMDPTARVDESFKYRDLDKVQESTMKEAASLISSTSSSESVGVDVELVSAINIDNKIFLERNFTPQEQEYCSNAADPRASYAGTWSAKEAVFKALETSSKGAGAALIDIEILRSDTGPQVKLHGEAAKVANGRKFKLSISHNDLQAMAVAIATA